MSFDILQTSPIFRNSNDLKNFCVKNTYRQSPKRSSSTSYHFARQISTIECLLSNNQLLSIQTPLFKKTFKSSFKNSEDSFDVVNILETIDFRICASILITEWTLIENGEILLKQKNQRHNWGIFLAFLDSIFLMRFGMTKKTSSSFEYYVKSDF